METVTIEDMYVSFRKNVFSVCQRLLGDPAEAEDAAQEVFVRTMVRGRALPTPIDARRYLYRVAENHCFNLLRRKRRAQRAPSLESGLVPSGEQRLADRQILHVLERVCGPRDLVIARLCWLEGLSNEEAAALCGCTRRTIYNRLRRIARAAELLDTEVD